MIDRKARFASLRASGAVAALLALAACDATTHAGGDAGAQSGGSQLADSGGLGNEPPQGDGGSTTGEPGSSGGSGAGMMSAPDGGAGSSGSDPNHPPLGDQVCSNGGACLEVAASGVDKVDLLFMVDNSGSMREEQAALRAQFPALVRALTTGDLDGDGAADGPAAKSLHLGVVSSDLGLVGISSIDKCTGLGDDGVMNNVPSPELSGCASEYPRFLTYQDGLNDLQATANDFACIATLGTQGCGFEQQLESTLKALWPADDPRVTFLPDPQGFGAVGQGDNGGMNAGFLRNDAIEGLSAIAVVLVTDEEDCSSKDTRHFTAPAFLDPSNPTDAELLNQGLNTRCFFNQQNLYIKDRYINGLKALRPGNEDLVLFSAIVGVPPDTVADVPADWATSDAARAAFYQGIVDHPLMLPMVDTRGTPDPADDNMAASCETPSGKAYPPNRIVDVAQGFGANGMVQSICQDDFGPAIENIVARIASRLGDACLPRPLVLGGDGTVGCELRWLLPEPSQAPASTPTTCSALPFLSEAEESTLTGRAVCTVAQLAVSGASAPSGSGWYYDDFSDEAAEACRGAAPARVAYTPDALPPTGVRAFLDCGQ